MLEDSIRTVLIPAWQQARRPGNGRGSVACTEQGRGSGITRSEPFVSVSHIRSRVYFLEDEAQWEMTEIRCHTVIKVALRHASEDRMLSSAVQSVGTLLMLEPMGLKVDLSMTNLHLVVIAGSPLLVWWNGSTHLRGDGVPILPKVGL